MERVDSTALEERKPLLPTRSARNKVIPHEPACQLNGLLSKSLLQGIDAVVGAFAAFW